MWENVGLVMVATFAAAATVDLLKEVTPIQVFFNRWSVRRWLRRGLELPRPPFWQELSLILWNAEKEPASSAESSQSAGSTGPMTSPGKTDAQAVSVSEIEARLLSAINAGDRWTVYRSATSQFAAQANALADRILDFPDTHEPLLRALAGPPPLDPKPKPGSEPTTGKNPTSQVPPSRRDRWSAMSPSRRWEFDIEQLCALKEGFRVKIEPQHAGEYTGDALFLVEARARVTQSIQRRLDELQTQGRVGWRVSLLITATLVAFGVCLLMGVQSTVVAATGADGPPPAFAWLRRWWQWLQAQSHALGYALIAGLLSSAAHDILTLLRRRSER